MKARAVEAGPGALVIACDTDVVLDGKALGKPQGEVEAREYLDRMSGRAHEVLSGLGVVLGGGEERSGMERTSVFFRDLSEVEKERYVRFEEGVAGGFRRLPRSRRSARPLVQAGPRRRLQRRQPAGGIAG